jgi:hypothetical protein
MLKLIDTIFMDTTIPTKPSNVAISLNILNRSFRNITANIDTKIGMVKLMVVAKLILTTFSPIHQKEIPQNNKAPLIKCKGILVVMKDDLFVYNHGNNVSVANINLRNTT